MDKLIAAQDQVIEPIDDLLVGDGEASVLTDWVTRKVAAVLYLSLRQAHMVACIELAVDLACGVTLPRAVVGSCAA